MFLINTIVYIFISPPFCEQYISFYETFGTGQLKRLRLYFSLVLFCFVFCDYYFLCQMTIRIQESIVFVPGPEVINLFSCSIPWSMIFSWAGK